jgi:CTP synthase
VTWVEATDLENNSERAMDVLRTADGVLIPGGFGARGAEGKILAAKFARETKVPYLGICYGFQLALVEFARTVLGFEDAHTTEVAPNTTHPVICILPEQHAIAGLGASMRLGGSNIEITPGTLAHRLYGTTLASERHRHRYEVNPDYVSIFEEAGMVFSGRMPGRPIMEIMELPEHPYFIGGQFHPEFKSRPEKPAPVFHGFVEAALAHKQRRERGEDWNPPTRGRPNGARPAGVPAREALAARNAPVPLRPA